MDHSIYIPYALVFSMRALLDHSQGEEQPGLSNLFTYMLFITATIIGAESPIQVQTANGAIQFMEEVHELQPSMHLLVSTNTTMTCQDQPLIL